MPYSFKIDTMPRKNLVVKQPPKTDITDDDLPIIQLPPTVTDDERRHLLDLKHDITPYSTGAISDIRKSLFIKCYPIYDCNATRTCQMLKIPRTTYLHWIQDDPAFSPALEKYKKLYYDELLRCATNTIHSEVMSGNLTAAMFVAKTLGKKDFSEQTHIITSNKDKDQFAAMSDAELDAILEVEKQRKNNSDESIE